MIAAKAFATVTNLCMQAFQEIPDRISVENDEVTEFPQYPGCHTCVKVTLTKGEKRYFFYAACLDEESCLIYNFDGVPVSFTGKKNYFLVFLEIWAEGVKEEFAEEISLKVRDLEDISITTNGGQGFDRDGHPLALHFAWNVVDFVSAAEERVDVPTLYHDLRHGGQFGRVDG